MRTAKDVYLWQIEVAERAGLEIVKISEWGLATASQRLFAEVAHHNIEAWGQILKPRLAESERVLEDMQDEINQLKGIIEIAEALEEIRANA